MSPLIQFLDREAALERLDGDEELLQEIIGIFLEDAPRLFLALKQARLDHDHKTTERQAHSLKGASANVGAVHLQAICLKAEAISKAGQWEELEALLPELESSLHATLDQLRGPLE